MRAFSQMAQSQFCSRRAALVVAGSCCLLGAAAFAVVKCSLANVEDAVSVKKSDRLAVNVAVCFAWPAVMAVVLCALGLGLGLVGWLACLVVLVCLTGEVRAVSAYVGPLSAYQGGGTLTERSTQISAAAFAAGTILLSAGGDLVGRVSPFVFLALLFCVLSAVPTGSSRNSIGRGAFWDAWQKAGMSFAAGLLAVAIATCVDVKLKTAGGS